MTRGVWLQDCISAVRTLEFGIVTNSILFVSCFLFAVSFLFVSAAPLIPSLRLQVMYFMLAKFNGFEGPEPRNRVTQSWVNNPKCCGSTSVFPYPCELAVFQYMPRAGGTQDLSLYKATNTTALILTIKGIWYSPTSLSLPLPPTKTWAPGFMRWFLTDIITIENGTSSGEPVKVGNVLANTNFGDFRLGLCGIDSWGGPARADMPGEVIPLGAGSNSPAEVYWQFLPYF
jgi:hypothetical protein